ncbi:Cytochrome P450 [Metarhizium rileyi]|uniref:Cytochrome P450 n=1 Tax=Metarhizium rileyi (strain RCEF 4871) TaxID=1649241 RepID=A0A167A4D7_METRR|nr:Cytochrome P450 [Metarhizium rileyi RCEF 4871]
MTLLKTPTSVDLGLAIGALSICYVMLLVIYRLWLSPVAGFPGSIWPKITFWYEFYYEWIRPGQYHRKIHEMHQKYGPIIRVSPNEIHISDPPFYHELFVPFNVRRTNAYTRYARGTGFEDIFALVATHEGHKTIRDPVEKLYSRISLHETLVKQSAQNFCFRLDQARDANEPINLSHACLSLAIDVATTTTFQHPSDYLKDPNFNKTLFDTQRSGLKHVPLFAHLPLLARIFTSPLIEFLSSRIPELSAWDEKIRRQTFREELQEPTMKLQGRASVWKRSSFASRVGKLIQQNGIFHVSHTIETVITYLAINKHQRQSLKDELARFWEEHPHELGSWSALRRLPYLTACIQEGLRLGAGSMKRSPRVFPDDEIHYKDWVIPKNTPISMTTYYMHMDPTVFPEPEKFNPQRWLNSDPDGLMHSYLLPFGKGSRACAGQKIAWMQMYFCLSQLYRPSGPDIELFESDESDVRLAHGYVFPQPRMDSPGVRVLIHSAF